MPETGRKRLKWRWRIGSKTSSQSNFSKHFLFGSRQTDRDRGEHTHTEGQVNRAQVKIIRAGQRIAHCKNNKDRKWEYMTQEEKKNFI